MGDMEWMGLVVQPAFFDFETQSVFQFGRWAGGHKKSNHRA